MQNIKYILAFLAITAVAVPFAMAEDTQTPKPTEPAKQDAEPAEPAKEDAAKFSYHMGYRNGKVIAAAAEQNPADKDVFLRGLKVALGLEEPQPSDQGNADRENVDYKKGVALGRLFASFGKQRFRYLDHGKVAEGVQAGIAGEEPAYTPEEFKAAGTACSKFVRQPVQPPSPMLGKEAPKWDVGPWHQLPSGKDSLDISDFRGKVLYLYCFQSWCPGCHKQGFPTLQRVSKKYEDDDGVRFVVFQTVFEDRADKPVNTFENLKKLAKKFELTMPFAQSGSLEDKSKVMRAYKTGGTPWTMIIDKEGIIRHSSFVISPANAVKLIEELKAEGDESE